MDQIKQEEAMFSIDQFFNRFTLIIGDINTGKTTLTQKLLDACIRQARGDVAVVDLAPTIVETGLKGKNTGIGGRLSVRATDRVRYFHCKIHAPRLKAKDEKEALELAAINTRSIESLFEKALEQRVDAFFVNDCSLYLHAGKAEKLLRWIGSAATAVVNGYYGNSLGPGPISARERKEMEFLINHSDRLIRLAE